MGGWLDIENNPDAGGRQRFAKEVKNGRKGQSRILKTGGWGVNAGDQSNPG
jgi:hypothetical protein